MNWPAEGPLELPAFDARILGTRTLTGGTAVVDQTEEGIVVDLAKPDRDEIATMIELTVDQVAFEIEPVDVRSRSK